MMGDSQGLAVVCNRDGVVLEVISETVVISRPPATGSALRDVLASDNAEKLAFFMDELANNRAAFEWSINVDTPLGARALSFSGVADKDHFIILASADNELDDLVEQVASMNSELVNAVRNLKQRSAAADVTIETEEGRRRTAEEQLLRRGVQLEQLLAERERNLARVRQAFDSIVNVVGTLVETRDPYTAGHERRVAQLAVRISEEMGLPADQIDEIRTASLIHDVGKVSIPAEILTKPGKLSTIEFDLIKTHSESGYRIISLTNMEESIAEMIYEHHERCDGSGYPRGLACEDLLLGSKVIMVADVVEAMTSDRPYRPGLGAEAALAEVEAGCGTLFDPDVCEACLSVMREQGFQFESD